MRNFISTYRAVAKSNRKESRQDGYVREISSVNNRVPIQPQPQSQRMHALVRLRYREQNLLAYCHYKFKESGWTYEGFLPGPEFVVKETSNSFTVMGDTRIFRRVEKDRWLDLMFFSENADGLPNGLFEVVLGRGKHQVRLRDRIFLINGSGALEIEN